MGELEVRPLEEVGELREAAQLWERIWSEQRVVTTELLRALSTHGNPVLGAFLEGEMVGAQMAFFGRRRETPILHSHVTGVLPGRQHAGVGAALKWGQRDWALAHGIEVVTWTFDPMLARNAYFNLHKLGARAERFHRAFYGELRDAFNAGERTDRLEIVWELRDPRVGAAAAGRPPEARTDDAAPALEAEEGHPVPRPADGDRLIVAVPSDYLALRERDRALATRWRDAVADALEPLLDAGYLVTGFVREGGYVLERA